jgi:hypothetical protein
LFNISDNDPGVWRIEKIGYSDVIRTFIYSRRLDLNKPIEKKKRKACVNITLDRIVCGGNTVHTVLCYGSIFIAANFNIEKTKSI